MFRKLRLLWLAFLDRRTPAAAKALVIGGLLYGVLPLDVVPDLIPVLGQLDDVGILLFVVALFLRMTSSVRKDLAKAEPRVVVHERP